MHAHIPHEHIVFAVLASALLVNADFPGWQELRVIHQEGRPMRMQAGDIDADGRDEMELLLEELKLITIRA